MNEMTHSRWWNAPLSRQGSDYVNVANNVVSYARWLADMHQTRYWRERVYQALYENQINPGATTASVLKAAGFTATRLNITRRIVETMVARLGTKNAAVKANPSDVDYSLKRRAKQFTKFIRGKLEELEIQDLRPRTFRDCCVVGSGGVHIFPRFGEICAERVLREELFVDPREGRYGKPRQMFRRKAMAREVVMELFGKNADVRAYIRDAATCEDPYDFEDASGSTDMVEVWEGWHLPSGPDADDGRHVIAISNRALVWERWERPRFPIALLHYSQNRTGFWGRGLVEDLADMQYKVNETVRDIQDSLYFGAQLKVWVRRGTVAKNKLGRQQRSSFIEYDGAQPPQYDAPNPVSKDQLAFLQYLEDAMYKQAGIPEDTAGGADPLGPNASGIARMEFFDQQSQRYADIEHRIGRWNVEIGEIMIDTAQDLAMDPDRKVTAKWNRRNVMEQIDWRAVDMKRDQYRLTLENAGIMPDTRSGKIEMSEQLSKLGILKGAYVPALLTGHPDLDRATAVMNAPLEHVEYLMEKLEEADVPLVECLADGHVNFDLYEEHAMAGYARAITDEAPEEIKQRFRDAILDVRSKMGKLQEAMPPQQPPMGPEMGGPGQMPMGPDVGGALPPGPAPEAMPGEALPGLPAGPMPGGGM